VADMPVVCPFHEGHLAHQPRLQPDDAWP
jgi:hypothetical protein